MEAVVTGPGRAILLYVCQSLGEGLSLGEARDAMFTLSGVIAWVGKPAQLSTKPVSLGDGRWIIAQAIAEGNIELRGLATRIPFHLHQCHSVSVIKTCPHDQPMTCKTVGGSPAWALGRTVGARLDATVRPELRAETTAVMGGSTPVTPSLLSDHGFKSDRSTASTSSSMSVRSGGSRHPCCG